MIGIAVGCALACFVSAFVAFRAAMTALDVRDRIVFLETQVIELSRADEERIQTVLETLAVKGKRKSK